MNIVKTWRKTKEVMYDLVERRGRMGKKNNAKGICIKSIIKRVFVSAVHTKRKERGIIEK